MSKTIKMSMGVGASSLIMIFVILTTVTLATLTLGTAHADYNLSVKSAKGAEQFYGADRRAEELLAQIDEILEFSEVNTFIQELSVIPELKLIDEGGMTYIDYQVEINERQELNVRLEVEKSLPKGGLGYKIIAWNVNNSSSWNYNEDGLGFEDIIIEE